MEEILVQIFIPYERSFSLVFWEKEWLMGYDPFYVKFLVNWSPLERNCRCQPIFARRASGVTPSNKSSIKTDGESTTRFPIGLSLRWSLYVAPKPPKGGGLKTQNGRFLGKITHRLQKVCYKVSLCENCQRLSCKAFSGLTICAKTIGGGDPSTWNFRSNWPRWSEIADFRSIFAHSASAVTPSKKVKLKLIGRPLCPFQWAQDEHRTLSLRPPPIGWLKTPSVQNLNNKLR